MSDVMLVHGSTQSAAGFWRLADSLAQRGHRVLTVDVPSAAASSSAEYAELLTGQLPGGLHRPVIAAHSAAGLLLPALADRLDASHQIWLAAAVAHYAGGRSLVDEVRADPTAIFHPEWVGVDPTGDPVLATYFLFHDADLAILHQALLTVARCDLPAVYAETPSVDPAARPSIYLLPTGDRALTPRGCLSVREPGIKPRRPSTFLVCSSGRHVLVPARRWGQGGAPCGTYDLDAAEHRGRLRLALKNEEVSVRGQVSGSS